MAAFLLDFHLQVLAEQTFCRCFGWISRGPVGDSGRSPGGVRGSVEVLVRRYLPSERRGHGLHYDGHAFVTAVLGVSEVEDFRGGQGRRRFGDGAFGVMFTPRCINLCLLIWRYPWI